MSAYNAGAPSLRLVRDDGREMRFGDTRSGWHLPPGSLDKFAEPDISVTTSENVLTDGSFVVMKRVGERDRTVEGAVYLGPDPALARANAVSFFNPKHTFAAHLSYRGASRWCEGELYRFAAPLGNVNAPPEVSFTLLCPDPYMMGEDSHEKSFNYAKPMFGFPYVAHMRQELPDGAKHPVGSMASVLLYSGNGTVVNDGDVPTRYKVEVVAHGELQRPRIRKDSGASGGMVLYEGALSEGDALVIDFEKTPPTVELNGSNVIQRCSRDSNFGNMEMDVGRNVFTFSIDNQENMSLADVYVRFNSKYLGV